MKVSNIHEEKNLPSSLMLISSLYDHRIIEITFHALGEEVLVLYRTVVEFLVADMLLLVDLKFHSRTTLISVADI